MLMYNDLRNNQHGAIAMITVIFVAILLTVITTSFIRLAVNEQREATDDDLTTRAFYAAESGVQDALRAIENNQISGAPLANADECAPESGDGSLSVTLDTAYTCQTIKMVAPNYEADLAKDEQVFFKLDSGSNNIASFTVSWHKYGDEADGTNAILRGTADTWLPTTGVWNEGTPPTNLHPPYPAMLRLQILEVPNSDITRQKIDNGNSVGFLNPTDSATSSIGLAAVNGGVTNAHCDVTGLSSGQYACKMTVKDLDDTNNSYYLRIGSLYRKAFVQVVAYTDDLATNPVSLHGAQAVIDVTGRAGDVFRRIEERVNLANDSMWPPYAIESGESICKDFVITKDSNEFISINGSAADAPWSCSNF